MVTADIHSIDPDLLKQEEGADNQMYYVMDFDIEMRCSAAKLEFTPIYCHGDNGKIRFAPAVFETE